MLRLTVEEELGLRLSSITIEDYIDNESRSALLKFCKRLVFIKRLSCRCLTSSGDAGFMTLKR